MKKVLHYCDQRLNELGLTKEDLKAEVQLFGIDAYERRVARESVEMIRIQPGTFDKKYSLTTGPDMCFVYLGLDKGQMTYIRPKARKELPFFRVRYSNPGAHRDKYGTGMKYQSPPESGVFPWLPNKVIEDFDKNRKYDLLVITEGELKAEKLTKAGQNAIGIGGITMFASKGQTLSKEYEMIIRQNGIKKILFLMDSDCFDLSDDLKENPNKQASRRPWAFYTAAKKFKEYFKSFEVNDLYLELFIGWTHRGDRDEKGVDDLLADTLRKKEHLFTGELFNLTNEPPKKTDAIPVDHAVGKYSTVCKITEVTDSNLKQLWHLESVESFARGYRSQLIPLGKFNWWKEPWNIDEDGNISLARPLTRSEQYWTFEEGRTGEKMVFYYQALYEFLVNRSFGRWAMPNNEFIFIRIEDKVVKDLEPYQVRDFVTMFTKEALQDRKVLELLYRGGTRYLGKESLSNLSFLNPEIYRADKDSQNLFFLDKFWRVTASGIESRPMGELPSVIWDRNRIKFKPEIAEPLFDVRKIKEEWIIEHKPEAFSCDFYRFICLTSEYHWKAADRAVKAGIKFEYSDEQLKEHLLGALSKITAIGYLLHQYFNPARTKAVIGMDATMGEVGSSRGRSGKSLIAVGLEKVLNVHFVNGKKQRLTQDPFWLDGVDQRTDVVWIDDVLKSFNFEDIFPHITGRFHVNPKGMTAFNIEPEFTPKFYIPTNHAIHGEGGSFEDRQFMVGFSDYFHKDRKPEDVFESRFFDDWSSDQWELFYRFMATCLVTYFNHGLIAAPTVSLKHRKLRQAMGEDFFSWAEDYYSPDNGGLNKRLDKKSLQANFEADFPKVKKYMNVRRFKRNIQMFCEMMGYHFNPNKAHQETGEKFNPSLGKHIGKDDKSNGSEFFTVATDTWTPAHNGEMDF